MADKIPKPKPARPRKPKKSKPLSKKQWVDPRKWPTLPEEHQAIIRQYLVWYQLEAEQGRIRAEQVYANSGRDPIFLNQVTYYDNAVKYCKLMLFRLTKRQQYLSMPPDTTSPTQSPT